MPLLQHVHPSILLRLVAHPVVYAFLDFSLRLRFQVVFHGVEVGVEISSLGFSIEVSAGFHGVELGSANLINLLML